MQSTGIVLHYRLTNNTLDKNMCIYGFLSDLNGAVTCMIFVDCKQAGHLLD